MFFISNNTFKLYYLVFFIELTRTKSVTCLKAQIKDKNIHKSKFLIKKIISESLIEQHLFFSLLQFFDEKNDTKDCLKTLEIFLTILPSLIETYLIQQIKIIKYK